MKSSRLSQCVNAVAVTLVLIAMFFQARAVVSGNFWALSALIFYATLFYLLLTRHSAQESAGGFRHWLPSLCGTFLPFLMASVKSPGSLLLCIGIPLQILGIMVTYCAIFALGKGFGIVAAKRQVKTHGIYRWVRHPLYAGEAIWFLSLIVQNLSWYNVILFCIQVGFQLQRIRQEEALLSKDETYAQYLTMVPFRLIPGLF